MKKNILFIVGFILFGAFVYFNKHDSIQNIDPNPKKLKPYHNKLFALYFPNSTFLTDVQKELRKEQREKAWHYIQSHSEAKALLEHIKKVLLPVWRGSRLGGRWVYPNKHKIEAHINRLAKSLLPEESQMAFNLRKLYLTLAYPDSFSADLAGITLPERGKGAPQSIKPQHALMLKGNDIVHREGEVDYLIVGSGPAGSVIAHELTRKHPHARVVLLDAGSFVTPGSIDTSLDADFIESHNLRTTVFGGIALRNGEAVGGGTIPNIDLAFSPLLPMVQERLNLWRQRGLKEAWVQQVPSAYDWVKQHVGTRKVTDAEINKNNRILLNGISTARTYDLNQKPYGQGHPILKNNAVEAFLLPAMKRDNPLIVLSNARVRQVNFEETPQGRVATSVSVRKTKTVDRLDVIKDFSGLNLQEDKTYTLRAKTIILSAGTLGSANILHQSKVNNPLIGQGIVIHPSMAVVGEFNHDIDVHKGLSASVYALAEDSKEAYYFEAMGDVPSFLSLIHPGSGMEILKMVQNFRKLGGFGVMLVDSVHWQNRIDDEGQVHYQLSESDKERMRKALLRGVNLLFDQGAKRVFIPSREIALKMGKGRFDSVFEARQYIRKLTFAENLNFITSAHMQGSNKLAKSGHEGVVSPNFRVFDGSSDREIPNLYVVDSSVFPTSVGANPMQSIYTLAKIFVDQIF